MIKDRFVIGILVATILIFIGGAFFISKKDSKTQEDTSKLLEVVSDDYIKGSNHATVTVIEYLDFECEVCGTYYPLLKQLSEEFKTDVRFVSRYFPLPGHKNGIQSALAVEASNKQGKYWEMYDILFKNQKVWGEKKSTDPTIFEGYAKQIGLNVDQFKRDVASKEILDRVNRDKSSGEKIGITGTPTFYLNGEKIQNPRTIDDFRTLIKAAILKAQPALGEKVHEHADIKVNINGKSLDLSQAKYQSTEEKELDPDTHFHDGNGNVAHKHRKGVTLDRLFKSLKIDFSKGCLILDTGNKYCNDDSNSLKFFVNGKSNDAFNNYELSDLDRILISFGPKDEVLDKQLETVTDTACMYSEKCPERGKPPTEHCVGGLGSDC